MSPLLPAILALAASLTAHLPDPEDDALPNVAAMVAGLASTDHSVVNHALFGACRPPIGPNATKALLSALDSANYQQRHGAAQMLREPGNKHCPVTNRLVEVTIEGLRNDSLPGKPVDDVTLGISDAAGFRWLITHFDASRELLIPALFSDDLQQRFLAAVCLAAGGDHDHTARIAEILLPHLRDNQIAGDAMMAGCALYRLGNTVIPSLIQARRSADKQQKQIIDLIIFDLTNPPLTPKDFERRKGLQDVWAEVYDPIAWYKPEELSIEWFGKMTEARRDTPGPLEIKTNDEAEEQVGGFNEVLVQVTGVVDRRKNGLYLKGQGLDLRVEGLPSAKTPKPGERLAVRGRLEWIEWPAGLGASGAETQTKTQAKADANGQPVRELVLRVDEK